MSVDEVSGVEFVVTVAVLSFPSQSTVFGMKNNTGPTDHPPLFLVDEKDPFNHFVKVAWCLLYPRFATVCCMQHGSQISNDPAFLWIDEMEGIEGIPPSAGLPFPRLTCIGCVEDEPAVANRPAFPVSDER